MEECRVLIFGHCDFELMSRINVSGAYLLNYLRQESQILCVDASWDEGAQWLSGRVLDSSLTVVTALWSLSKTFILA